MTRPGYYEDDRVLYQCQRRDCRGYARSRLPWYEVRCEGTLSSPHAPKQMEPIDDEGQEATNELVVAGHVWRSGNREEPVEYDHHLGMFVTPRWAR